MYMSINHFLPSIPKELTSHILEALPFQEAFRMAQCSQNWRYTITLISQKLLSAALQNETGRFINIFSQNQEARGTLQKECADLFSKVSHIPAKDEGKEEDACVDDGGAPIPTSQQILCDRWNKMQRELPLIFLRELQRILNPNQQNINKENFPLLHPTLNSAFNTNNSITACLKDPFNENKEIHTLIRSLIRQRQLEEAYFIIDCLVKDDLFPSKVNRFVLSDLIDSFIDQDGIEQAYLIHLKLSEEHQEHPLFKICLYYIKQNQFEKSMALILQKSPKPRIDLFLLIHRRLFQEGNIALASRALNLAITTAQTELVDDEQDYWQSRALQKIAIHIAEEHHDVTEAYNLMETIKNRANWVLADLAIKYLASKGFHLYCSEHDEYVFF